MDQEERPWSKKWGCLIFLYMHKKRQFPKKNPILTILLASILLYWPHFFFLLVFTLNFNKHGWNGGEEEEPSSFAFRIIHVFVHACEVLWTFKQHFLQGEWKKVAILSLVYESMGYRKKKRMVKNGCPDL